MQTIDLILIAFVRGIVPSRTRLQLENIVLRQQVAVLKRDRDTRPTLIWFSSMRIFIIQSARARQFPRPHLFRGGLLRE